MVGDDKKKQLDRMRKSIEHVRKHPLAAADIEIDRTNLLSNVPSASAVTLGTKDEVKSRQGLKDQPSFSKLKEVRSPEVANIKIEKKIQTMKSNGFNIESNAHT